MKTRGREDNLMYKISDGYNLETNDKTFWDQNNIYDLIISRKVPSKSPLRLKTNSSAIELLGKVKTGVEIPTLDLGNSANSPNFGYAIDNESTPDGISIQKPLSPILKAPAVTQNPSAILKQLTQPVTHGMTLEEKILHGVFKTEQ